ncbi:MAG: hypothetical protein Q8Q06_00385 [bacterium]|nr:hypothetical protein [bacterium]
MRLREKIKTPARRFVRIPGGRKRVKGKMGGPVAERGIGDWLDRIEIEAKIQKRKGIGGLKSFSAPPAQVVVSVAKLMEEGRLTGGPRYSLYAREYQRRREREELTEVRGPRPMFTV